MDTLCMLEYITPPDPKNKDLARRSDCRVSNCFTMLMQNYTTLFGLLQRSREWQ